jgi:hypothetical protein
MRQLPWLTFCHALLFQLGPLVVPVFLDLGVIPAFSKFISADPAEMGYVHLLSMMISGASDDESTRILLSSLKHWGRWWTSCTTLRAY